MVFFSLFFICIVLLFFVVCRFIRSRGGTHAGNTAAGQHSVQFLRGHTHSAYKLHDFKVFRFGFLRFQSF